jgi:4-carboxymuconolactone decarboxylase
MSAVSGSPGLPASARETAILAMGSQYHAPYEIYAHERVALKSTSLTKELINSIKNGKKPEGLGREESVAFDVAVELGGGK